MPTYSEELLRLAEIDARPIPAGIEGSERANRLCGDRVTVAPLIAQNHIQEMRWSAEGCAILKASAAFLAQSMRGKSAGEALAFIELFRDSFTAEDRHLPGPMAAVYRLPARYKCALLPFEACEDYLRKLC